VCVSRPQFQRLRQLTDIYETWYVWLLFRKKETEKAAKAQQKAVEQ
jgi:hypothetical protein